MRQCAQRRLIGDERREGPPYLWLAERNFRRVKGYKQLPKLLAKLAKLNTPPPAQARAA